MKMKTVDGQYYSPSALEGGIIGLGFELTVIPSHHLYHKLPDIQPYCQGQPGEYLEGNDDADYGWSSVLHLRKAES